MKTSTFPTATRSRSRSSLLFLTLLFISNYQVQSANAVFGGSRGNGCIKMADQGRLNKMFSDGGPGTKIQLCQSTTYPITGPITFTAKDQELSTEGYPTSDDLKARIVLVGSGSASGSKGVGDEVATAIQGDCRRCARVSVKNLIVDGNRKELGRIVESDGKALVLLGNNEGQSVVGCRIHDPRGWTAIQIREGDALSCTGAIIENNSIGPSGDEWDESIDGEEPELSPLGRPLADGLSLACRDSIVRGNTFVDNTGAAIVIYGAPGSNIDSNYIKSERVSPMAGILMIDYTPFDGDYSNTVVHNNTIEADESTLMRIAIGLGTPVWSDDDDTEMMIHGGKVTGNILRGLGMGYGIAASNVKDFVVLDNESTARHGGYRGKRCLVPVDSTEKGFDKLSEDEKENGVVKNPLPMAFVRNPKVIKGGEWQEDFVDGEFSYLVCLDPDPSIQRTNSDSHAPTEPNNILGRPEEHQPKTKPDLELKPKSKPILEDGNDHGHDQTEREGGKSVVDEILFHSQNRMLKAMQALGEKVDGFVEKAALERMLAGGTDGKRGFTMEEDGVKILASLSHISNRVATLESERKNMGQMMDDFRLELEAFGHNVKRTSEQESAALRELQQLLSSAAVLNRNPSNPDTKAGDTATPVLQRMRTKQVDNLNSVVGGFWRSWMIPFTYLFSFQIVLAMLVLGWQRWKNAKKQVKVI